MATIAPLARVRCPRARGERPREGLAAAVAGQRGCRPRSPWTAPLPPWAVRPSSQGLLLPLVGADEVAQAGAALADDVEGDDVHADAFGLGMHREPQQGEPAAPGLLRLVDGEPGHVLLQLLYKRDQTAVPGHPQVQGR